MFSRHSDTIYYDKRTFFVDSGVAHQEQIQIVFDQIITQIGKPTKYWINLVTSIDQYLGYTYVRVDNPEVYEAISKWENDLPTYEYDEEQIKYLHRKGGNVPKKGSIDIYQAYVKDLSPNFCSWTLVSRDIHPWITRDDIKSIFTPFGYNPNINFTNHTTEDGREIRSVFVSFGVNTTDASFILLIIRRTEIKMRDGKTVCLFFNHSYNKPKIHT